jgi:hypothetical protein
MAVSFPARDAGLTRALYAFQLRQWLTWCNGLGPDPLVGVQCAHVEFSRVASFGSCRSYSPWR